jgi:hypothetical protein
MSSTSATVSVEERDYLDQDPPLRGQGYVCLSFLSPEEIIVKREAFYFSKFLEAVGQDVSNLLDGISTKFGSTDPDVMETVRILRARYSYLDKPQDLDSEFKFFMEKKSTDLDKQFNESVQFRTSVRGIKVRGVYESLPEAVNRVEAIKRFDTKHNVYVAEIGCWCPWSPNPEDIKDVKYAETQLNTLMKSYKDNASVRDEHYQTRKDDLIKAISERAPQTHSEQLAAVEEAASTADDSTPESTPIDPPADALGKIEIIEG